MKKFIVFLFCIIIFSCNKDSPPAIPYAEVNVAIYPNALDYVATGEVKLLDYGYGKGYKGLVIYRLAPGEFKIYERACPHDFSNPEAVLQYTNSEPFVYCSVCKTKYNLLDGSVFAGVSKYGLREYRYFYNTQREELRIYN